MVCARSFKDKGALASAQMRKQTVAHQETTQRFAQKTTAAGELPAAAALSKRLRLVSEIDSNARTAIGTIVVVAIPSVVIRMVVPAMMAMVVVMTVAVPPMAVPMAMAVAMAMALTNLVDRTILRGCHFSDASTASGHSLSGRGRGENYRTGSEQGHCDQFSHGCFPFYGWSRLNTKSNTNFVAK